MRGSGSEPAGGDDNCVACGLAAGTIDLPGGAIHQTPWWRVEHCIGPLGVGTLIVKPMRHVTHVGDLNAEETSELGAVLQQTAAVVRELTGAAQVYVCLWSHGPAHIHFVVQPELDNTVAKFGAWGPAMQAAMFDANAVPDAKQVEAFAGRARRSFGWKLIAKGVQRESKSADG